MSCAGDHYNAYCVNLSITTRARLIKDANHALSIGEQLSNAYLIYKIDI